MKKSILMLLSVVAFAFITCQNEDPMVFNENEPSLMKSIALPDDMIENVAFGPEQFMRTKGKPNVYEVSLSSVDFECILPPYVLTVINGEDDGAFRVTSGRIYLDGELIFGPSNFKKKVYQLEHELDLTESSNLNIELASKPGSYIHIYITGEYNEECNQAGTFVDERDDNIYKWVKIGDQIWMAENLAYLPEVNPPTVGSSDDPFHYVYGYNGTSTEEAKATSNYQTYGVLYNWPAAMEGCPTGWHLPSDGEWSTLTSEISPDAALKLRALNFEGTDEYGFTSLPGGYRDDDYFNGKGYGGDYWTASVSDNLNPWFRAIGFFHSYVGRHNFRTKDRGLSVRCVKD